MTSSSPSPRRFSMQKYLAGAAGTTALLAMSNADASVVAVNLGSNAFSTGEGVGFANVTNVSTGANYGRGMYVYSSNHSLYLGRDSSSAFQIYNDNHSRAMLLTLGETVGDNPARKLFYFGAATFYDRNSSAASFTSNFTGQYIGFLTEVWRKPDGTLDTGKWGWANVDWNASTHSLTVNSAYVEDSGASITVGDTGVSAVPEPSRALLALAGMAGVALRRRRKAKA